MMPHRALSYTVDYLAADGRRRGTEACHVTVHADGTRTQRARSEIFDSRVLRDVVLTVDAAYRPVDALVRVRVDERTVGAGFFRFGDGFAECEAHTAREGRISQRMQVAGRPASFISHAVTGDVFHGASIARDRGADPQDLPTILSCSPLHNGASGPFLVPWPLRAAYLGVEEVEVPAGRFRAERIRYEEPTGELFLDTWCTDDGDRVMLRMHYPPYDSSYVLTSLTR